MSSSSQCAVTGHDRRANNRHTELWELPIMAYTRLSIDDRQGIARFLAQDPDASWTQIGACLGRHRSTIAREVTHNGGRAAYRPMSAHTRAVAAHPRRTHTLVTDTGLAARVTTRLEADYSPAGTARLEPGVCTETTYQAIYTGILGVKANDVLRTRRHRRRPHTQRHHRAPSHFLGQFVSIHDRPEPINTRSEFAHWEGNLIISAANASALITVCERVTKVQHTPHPARWIRR